MGVPAKERKERVLEVLRRMNMSQRGKHYPSQLSGGQQQRVAIARAVISNPKIRVAIARAVISNPKIILADEPTGNLDSKNGLEVMEMLSQLNTEGTTIIMVTHSQHDATYANRIINLYDGQIIENMNGLL